MSMVEQTVRFLGLTLSKESNGLYSEYQWPEGVHLVVQHETETRPPVPGERAKLLRVREDGWIVGSETIAAWQPDA